MSTKYGASPLSDAAATRQAERSMRPELLRSDRAVSTIAQHQRTTRLGAFRMAIWRVKGRPFEDTREQGSFGQIDLWMSLIK